MITSQIDTAPKLPHDGARASLSLITSQIDTAPKLAILESLPLDGLITSQIDTAPKPLEQIPPLRRGRTT